MNDAWDKIIQRVAEGTIDEFVNRYANHIVPARCQIEVISAEELRRSFKNMNRDRAVAPCGWRVCELRALGPELMTMMACLLDDIEKG